MDVWVHNVEVNTLDKMQTFLALITFFQYISSTIDRTTIRVDDN